MPIDGDTGKRATTDTRQPVDEAYLKGNEPADENGSADGGVPAKVCEKPPCTVDANATPSQASAADQMQKGGL